MITIGIDPVIVRFGHFALRWYGVIVVLAVTIGLWLAAREGRRKGLRSEHFSDAATWVVIAGFVGARLLHVIDHWPHEYSANPLRILYVWEGGLAIWGAVLGGLLALAAFTWRRGLSLGWLADIAAPGLVLAQGVGRIACIITGDAMGQPTTGPFGLAYVNREAMVPALGVYYTPTPVYEILMNLAIFGVIWRLRRKPLPNGALFLIYLLLYSTGRFVISFWSSYLTVAFGLNQAQLISLAALAIGLPVLAAVLVGSRRATRGAAGHAAPR